MPGMTLMEANIEIRANAQRAKEDLRKVEREVLGSVQRQSKVMSGMATKLGALFSVAVLGQQLRKVVRETAEFTNQLSMISTLLSSSTLPMMRAFEKELMRLAVTYGESTATLSKGLYDIISASVPAEHAIEVLETAVRAAKAGFTDTAVSADAITTVINAFGLEASDAAMVADKFFATIKAGKTTFAELGPAIGVVAAQAHAAGISLDEMFATFATVTRGGLRTRMAGRSFGGVITGYQAPSKEAVDTGAQYGIDISAQRLELVGMLGIMEDLQKVPKNLLAKMFPVEALRSLQILRATLQDFQQDVKNTVTENSMGEHLIAQQRAMEGLGSQLEQLGAAFGNLYKAVGRFSEGPAGGFVEWLTGVIDSLSKFPEKRLALIEKLATALAGLSLQPQALENIDKMFEETGRDYKVPGQADLLKKLGYDPSEVGMKMYGPKDKLPPIEPSPEEIEAKQLAARKRVWQRVQKAYADMAGRAKQAGKTASAWNPLPSYAETADSLRGLQSAHRQSVAQLAITKARANKETLKAETIEIENRAREERIALTNERAAALKDTSGLERKLIRGNFDDRIRLVEQLKQAELASAKAVDTERQAAAKKQAEATAQRGRARWFSGPPVEDSTGRFGDLFKTKGVSGVMRDAGGAQAKGVNHDTRALAQRQQMIRFLQTIANSTLGGGVI